MVSLQQDAVHPLILAQSSVLLWDVQYCMEIHTSMPWHFMKAFGRVVWCELPESSKRHG